MNGMNDNCMVDEVLVDTPIQGRWTLLLRRTFTLTLAIGATCWSAGTASAMEDVAAGRWITRDPLWYDAQRTKITREWETNLYGAIQHRFDDFFFSRYFELYPQATLYRYLNSMPGFVSDPSGLSPFQGCSEGQTINTALALDSACDQIGNAYQHSLNDNIAPDCIGGYLACMRDRCQDAPPHIHCDCCSLACLETGISGAGHAISGFFGLGSHVTICCNYINNSSHAQLTSTMAHEMSHLCGTVDPWAPTFVPGCGAADVEDYIRTHGGW